MSTLTLTKSYKKHQSWSQEYPPLAARKTVSKFKKYQPKIQSSSSFLGKRPDWKCNAAHTPRRDNLCPTRSPIRLGFVTIFSDFGRLFAIPAPPSSKHSGGLVQWGEAQLHIFPRANSAKAKILIAIAGLSRQNPLIKPANWTEFLP